MLFGDKIKLRAWSVDDLDKISAMRNDMALQQLLMTQPRANSREQVLKWLSEKSCRQDAAFFVIAETVTNVAIGYIQVVNIDLLHRFAYLGVCLEKGSQRKGYGYQATRLVESYLRTTFGLRKIMLHVLAENKSAIGFYLKAGFMEAGRFKEHFLLDGEFHDVLVMEKFISA